MKPIDRNSGEQGSVFVVALMVLVMLTVIGLSLALVTETEMLLGGNERVLTETFYAAEAGVAVATAQAMGGGSTDKQCFAVLALEDDRSERRLGLRKLGYSVDTTSLYTAAFFEAPLSDAAEGEGKFYHAFFRGEARALRGSWPEDRTVPREKGEELADIDFTLQGEKTIDMAFYVTPIKLQIDVDGFKHPDAFGCDPPPVIDELVVLPP